MFSSLPAQNRADTKSILVEYLNDFMNLRVIHSRCQSHTHPPPPIFSSPEILDLYVLVGLPEGCLWWVPGLALDSYWFCCLLRGTHRVPQGLLPRHCL